MWKRPHSFDIHKYEINTSRIDASKTRIEQQARVEKISLVAFLDKEQKRSFSNICRTLKQLDKEFYQNSNLHVTVFGFGPLCWQDTNKISKRIQDFFKMRKRNGLVVRFNTVRLGTMYSKDDIPKPIETSSNGTVIALGDVPNNRDFFNLSNKLTLFLLQDKEIYLILGESFRRKFPTTWCTLGYFDRPGKFAAGNDLQSYFEKYRSLENMKFTFRLSQLMLVKSYYKNLRYKRLICQYNI